MKKNYVFSAVIAVCLFITCTKNSSTNNGISDLSNKGTAWVSEAVTAGYKIYIIKKGAHYSSPNPLVFTSKSQLKFNAIFDSTCIYSTIDPHNQADINKLYGFSDCGTGHLINSGRIGWRWFNNQLELRGFVHIGGVIQPDSLLAVLPIGDTAHCRITCLDAVYEFEVNGHIVQMPRGCSGNYSRYKLYPYFGGDEVASHNIKILIQDL